ncbi:hypothetical protein [Bradyrhizobium sp. SYSU BS000235]|uniref:hypothetical protein n=1 Tax=Bradyrhizobium sp. SYSU BS000235 TaxID=3411332 RepID=UPI003C7719DC
METARSIQLALLSGCLLFGAASTVAQTSPAPNTTATRPADTPPGQTSAPNASPPTNIKKPTGSTDQDETVKRMNEEEKRKVDSKGK